jgi:putative ABC transport system permease protein
MARNDRLLVFSATLTLAVSIGANTTIFSIANSILVRPLPYPDPGRIDWISERSSPGNEEIGAAPDYYRLRDQNRVFEDIAAFNPITVNMTGVDRPEQLAAAGVSPSFFRVMGMRPALGRWLAPEEAGPKAPLVVVLSYAFWHSRMGGDPGVIGKTIALNRRARTVVGVMPQGFDFPRGAQMWLPSGIDEAAQRIIAPTQPIFTVSIVARRKADVPAPALAADLERVAALLRSEYKVFPTRFRWDLTIAAVPLQRRLTGNLRPGLLALGGAAGLVLLIACVNLANLLLARAANREREFAVRLALGASRGRIVRQALGESLRLAAPGGIAGVGLAWAAVRLLNAAKPPMLLPYPPIGIDYVVLGFTLALTVAAGVLFGMAPALSAAGVRVYETLKSAAATHSGGAGAGRLRKLLVVAELGVSIVLLIGAGLLARTFLKLAHTELGFRSDHVLTFRATPMGSSLGSDNAGFYRAVLERLQRLPDAQSAAVLSNVPLSDEDFYGSGRILVGGRPFVPFAERPIISHMAVSPEFFAALEIPLKSGRIFDAHDAARSAGTLTNYGMVAEAPVVVNEALVRRLFPGEDPLGRQLRFGPDRSLVTWTIVGVVGNIRGPALGADPPAMIYRNAWEGSRLLSAAFLVRTAGDPRAAIRAAGEQVRAVDRDLPIFDVRTMDERRAAALAPEQFQLAVIGSFAAVALLLAAAGVYGVVSYLVARRTREIGIRVAMGARPADVLGMVMGETAVLVLVASAVGLAGAWGLTRYLRSMLYGVTELDALTFGLAPALLAVVVLAACAGPARHASRIDPMSALREQ